MAGGVRRRRLDRTTTDNIRGWKNFDPDHELLRKCHKTGIYQMILAP